MLKMSFYDGTLNIDLAKEAVMNFTKPCIYTSGLSYRNPATYRQPVTKEEAIKIIENEPLLHITEEENAIHLNAYSENDMW